MVDSNSKPNRDTHPRVGLWRRIAALLYDGFLIAAIWVLLGFFILLLVGPNANQLVAGEVQTDSLVDNILFMLMVLSSASFYLYFWIRGGQTLGMLAWRIKVVDIK
ncbi:MAG: RDD family protein, partial [Pseudohongiellaceae bacterium]